MFLRLTILCVSLAPSAAAVEKARSTQLELLLPRVGHVCAVMFFCLFTSFVTPPL